MSGGKAGSDYLSSTELLVETASFWVYAGELPSPRDGLRGAYIENKVLMTGKIKYLYCYRYAYGEFADNYLGGAFYDRTVCSSCQAYVVYNDILEFDPLTERWKVLNWLIDSRTEHGLSVVRFDSGLSYWC